ncbi:TetR/AcrR family transcriptional regulator [Demequina silvatica]|uniref:TetR/AcrR family transcriptional regulator n=1 Tax=Demequina silvatica TaxID=1638988 RepID=UPI0007807821|nr:TetR/AcrR family transcriptional regulator [Demequina silvatica]
MTTVHEDEGPIAARQRAYAKGDRRRAQILREAFAAFSAGGYRGASMVQIAAACGVSRAGLQHHFPTKEALLAAVLEERDRVNGELFFAGCDARKDGIDYLTRLMRVLEHNVTQRELIALFATLSTEAADAEHPAHGYFADRYRWLRRDIDDALAEAASRGLLRPGVDLDGLSSDLIALIEGLQVQWLLDPDAVDLPRRVRAWLAQVVAADLRTG